MAKKEIALTLKWLEGGSNLTPMQFFQKCIFYRESERETDRQTDRERQRERQRSLFSLIFWVF